MIKEHWTPTGSSVTTRDGFTVAVVETGDTARDVKRSQAIALLPELVEAADDVLARIENREKQTSEENRLHHLVIRLKDLLS